MAVLRNPSDPRVHEALARLQGNDDWKTVRDWLETELGQLSRRTDTCTDYPQLLQAQGGAQTLRALLEKADDAREVVRSRQKAAQ